MTQDQFLQEVETFLRENQGWTATRFGKEAMRDNNFVFQIRNGRRVSLEVAEKVVRFMKANRSRQTRKRKCRSH